MHDKHLKSGWGLLLSMKGRGGIELSPFTLFLKPSGRN